MSDEIPGLPLQPGEPISMTTGTSNTLHVGSTIHLLLPKPVCELQIIPELRITSASPIPNRWWRFWYWVLLGWTWRKL